MCIHLCIQTHAYTSRMVIFASWPRGLRRGSAADRLLGLPVRILLRVWVFFPGVKRSGTEADHSPPASAKVKNEWNCTSSSLICLHVVDGENFIFIFYRNTYMRIMWWRISIQPYDCSKYRLLCWAYCYRVEETSRHAAATATLHFLPHNRPPCFQKPLQELISWLTVASQAAYSEREERGRP